MQYKHILVTGGAGFIGSHTVDYFIEQGKEVRIFDNLHPQIHIDGKPPIYLNKRAEFIRGDVTNRRDWQKALDGIDCVIHLAAAVGVGQSMYQIERYVKDNSFGTALFLDILANEKHSVKKMLVASSMTAYGEGMYECPKCKLKQQGGWRKESDVIKGFWEPACVNCAAGLVAIPTDETASLLSPSVYAITKKNQEELILSVGKTYEIPAVALRFFNALGPRQSLSNPYCGVAAIFLSRVKNGEAPIINEDGRQTRDFIYITDIVSAISMTIENSNADHQVFNVGTGTPISIEKVAKNVLSLNQSNIQPQITRKFRAFDIRHCFADTTKLKKMVGWLPKVSFEDGIKKVFEWSQHENAVDRVDEAFSELTKRGLL